MVCKDAPRCAAAGPVLPPVLSVPVAYLSPYLSLIWIFKKKILSSRIATNWNYLNYAVFNSILNFDKYFLPFIKTILIS